MGWKGRELRCRWGAMIGLLAKATVQSISRKWFAGLGVRRGCPRSAVQVRVLVKSETHTGPCMYNVQNRNGRMANIVLRRA